MKKMGKHKKMSLQKRRTLEGLMFVSPWILGALLFFLYPVFFSLRLSFSEIVSMKGFQLGWVGLKNYKSMLFYNVIYIPRFLATMKQTLWDIPIILVFSLFIAILINQNIKARGFFRTAFFIPVLLGTGYVMQYLLEINMGNVVSGGVGDSLFTDGILNVLGPSISSLVRDFMGRLTVALWKSGVQIILFLSGLQGIPNSIYEAAKCDGATAWESFWKITLPIISPIILLNFVYTMIESFTDTNNKLMYVILDRFAHARYDEGAAMGWFYFLFTFLLCGIALFIMNRLVYNIGEKE